MAYRLVFRPAAERAFDGLARVVQERIRPRLDALTDNPRPPGAVALQGRGGLLRIRVGDYRIIYAVQDDDGTIVVERIAHRREIYRQ
jgi:mRNA interferase RelE/StbE